MSRPGSALIACALLALAAGAAQAEPGVAIVNLLPGYRQAPRGQQRGGHEGSLRLQVTPKSAEVFVDGYLMGLVDDFDRGSRPFNQDVEVRADEATPVNVSLVPEPDR